jgi:hypothetical protein
MKPRYFPIFEKVWIFYSSLYAQFGTVAIIFVIIFISVGCTEIYNKIKLHNSGTYTEGKIIKTTKIEHKGRIYYDRIIAYKVNDTSCYCYQISYRSELDTIQEKINVKYLPQEPKISMLSKNSNEDIVEVVVVVVLFHTILIIGFLIFLYGTKKSLQNLYILENGELALGKFLSAETINSRIHKEKVMRMYFSFTDKYGKEQQTSIETHLIKNLQDEDLEMLVYMPNNVKQSIFLDTLPSFVRGRLEPEFLQNSSQT